MSKTDTRLTEDERYQICEDVTEKRSDREIAPLFKALSGLCFTTGIPLYQSAGNWNSPHVAAWVLYVIDERKALACRACSTGMA